MPDVKSNDSLLSRIVPFGLLGQTKPRHYREMFGVLWENRTELALRLEYSQSRRLRRLLPRPLWPERQRARRRASVHDPAETAQAQHHGGARFVGHERRSALRALAPEKLRSLGRLAYPMIRRKGERGFLRVSWDEAVDVVCKAIRNVAPHEMAFFATSRGLTNEVYYVFQKLARVLGHQQRRSVLAPVPRRQRFRSQGDVSAYGAPTCSLSDFIGTDLLVDLRLRPCQQSTGDDQVHALRQKSRHAHRRRQSDARVWSRTLLGAIGRGQRGLRHQAHGRFLSSAGRW